MLLIIAWFCHMFFTKFITQMIVVNTMPVSSFFAFHFDPGDLACIVMGASEMMGRREIVPLVSQQRHVASALVRSVTHTPSPPPILRPGVTSLYLDARPLGNRRPSWVGHLLLWVGCWKLRQLASPPKNHVKHARFPLNSPHASRPPWFPFVWQNGPRSDISE